jgi:hypothetical protein
MTRQGVTRRGATRRTGKRLLVPSLVVFLVLAVGGIANAYWKAGGSGTGSGTTGTTTNVTLSPGTATAGLYPGGTTDVTLSVSNSNLSPVRLGSLALDTTQGTGGFAVDAGHSGCTPLSTLSLTTQTNGGAGWTVPAKAGIVNGALAITLTGALAMSASGANACQGATFTVFLTAGP